MVGDADDETDLREGAVLFADVTGSTALYQAIGDRAAFTAIRRYLETLRSVVVRHDGVFVKSSGDDVLCWFPDANAAVRAAAEMMRITGEGDLEVHAGLEWGGFVNVPGDIFGDCVNAAARLCSMANQCELLVGEACYDRLDPSVRSDFVGISAIRLRGRSEASRIYSLQAVEAGDRTHLSDLPSEAFAEWDAVIEYEGRQWRMTEGEVLSVGRLDENIIRVPVRTVSRQHATIRLTNGLVEFEDHSSGGSAVLRQSGEVLAVVRRTVVLSGVGSVVLGAKTADPDAPRLYFEVVLR